jgi:hypothetical protein
MTPNDHHGLCTYYLMRFIIILACVPFTYKKEHPCAFTTSLDHIAFYLEFGLISDCFFTIAL